MHHHDSESVKFHDEAPCHCLEMVGFVEFGPKQYDGEGYPGEEGGYADYRKGI